MTTNKPFSHAKVALISADQGGGKSVTSVARNITAGLNNITGIINVGTGEYYDARPIPKEEKAKIISLGYKLTYNTVKIITPDKTTKIAPIPKGFTIIPSITIYTNYHLYGIKYKYLDSWGAIIKGLDDDTILDGRLSIDEYNIGASARDGMTALGKAIYKYNFSLRKRHLEVDIMIAHQRLGEWTSRLVVTEWVACSYDERTGLVTLTIKKKGDTQAREFSYNSLLYRKYYNTDERFKLPSSQVAKAIAQGM